MSDVTTFKFEAFLQQKTIHWIIKDNNKLGEILVTTSLYILVSIFLYVYLHLCVLTKFNN